MINLCRIYTLDEGATVLDPEDEKFGSLQVVHRGEVRWADPCFPAPTLWAPTELWLRKYAPIFGVLLLDQEEEDDVEQGDHLLYTGFFPLQNALTNEYLADFPNRSVMFSDRFELHHVGGDTNNPRIELKYRGSPDDSQQHPEGGTNVFIIDQTDGEESIALRSVAPNGDTQTIEMNRDGVRISAAGQFTLDIPRGSLGTGTQEPVPLGNQLLNWLTQFAARFDTHTHTAPGGATGTPLVPIGSPPSSINSQNMTTS